MKVSFYFILFLLTHIGLIDVEICSLYIWNLYFIFSYFLYPRISLVLLISVALILIRESCSMVNELRLPVMCVMTDVCVYVRVRARVYICACVCERTCVISVNDHISTFISFLFQELSDF